jgi:hypothetical protein
MIRQSSFQFLQSAIRGNPDTKHAAEREFGKAGLALKAEEIHIGDPVRWAEVSMLHGSKNGCHRRQLLLKIFMDI